MSFEFLSLNGRESLQAGELQSGQTFPIMTSEGIKLASWGLIAAEISSPLLARIESLEQNGGGGGGEGGGPSIWPVTRTITLSGAVTGSVAMDGSQNVSMSTAIADGSLTIAKVSGLQTQLNNIGNATNNRWGTGYTEGPQPTTYGGNLNSLIGATFVSTEAGTSNPPDAGNAFLILQNGPANYGQQIALRNGESWIRGQHLGTWSSWNKLWTSANLDPALLLLKSETATQATALANSRNFSLTGVITAAAVGFNGTGNVALSTAIADGALTIAKTSGLQTALDNRFTMMGALTTALNAVTASGYYTQATAGNATVPNNYPIALAGILRVVNQSGLITQEYLTSSNTTYRRVFSGSWSAWVRTWNTGDFDPATKYDKTGGQITGPLTVTQEIVGYTTSSAAYFLASQAADTTPAWLFLGNGAGDRQYGLQHDSLGFSLYNAISGGGAANGRLKMLNTGGITYNDNVIYHAGNFNPASPVPVSGVFNVGDTSGTHLRIRSDGQYSVNGGTTWRAINESSGMILDPHYLSVSIGADTDILLYEDSTPGTLTVRAGNSGSFTYFSFNANGNFSVPNGRVMIGGNEAWHAGNFDPATKLGVAANAASATRLQTARTINGVSFDGTGNITIPMTLGDSATLPGSTWFDVNNGSTGRGIIRNFGSTGVTFDAVNDTNTAFTPLNFTASALTFQGQTIYHAGNFNPATKLDSREELGIVAASVADWNNAVNNGWYMGAGALNAPAVAGGNWLMGRVTRHNAIWIQQEVFQFTAGASTTRYRRHCINNVWEAWTASQDFGGEISARPETGVSAYWADLPNEAQSGAFAMRWNNTRQWQFGMETTGAFKLWSYNANGSFNSTALEIARGGAATFGSSGFFGGEVRSTGHVRARGVGASFEMEDRTNSAKLWGLYVASNSLKFWNNDGGIVAFMNNDGSFHPSRVSAGWDSGMGGSVNASNWFRTTGATGLYFSDYGGGVFMQDSNYVRTYNGKAMAAQWFENYYTSWTPNTSAASAAYRATGTNGGGYSMVDGTDHMSIYSTAGNIVLGFGSGSITSSPISFRKNGEIYAADYLLTSDSRLKEELGPLAFKGRLRPVCFRWLHSGKLDFGFMAQEVARDYPDAVVEGSDGTMRLAQGKLTAVLASQVNRLEDDHQALIMEVDRLNNELVELRRLVEGMRKQ